METIEIYVRGHVNIPHRFYDLALRTNYKQESGARFYLENGFHFSEKHTEEYKNMTEDQREKVKFLYINGVKQF